MPRELKFWWAILDFIHFEFQLEFDNYMFIETL